MQRINCKNGDYWYIVSEQDRGDGVINCIIESNYGERFNLTSNFPKNAESVDKITDQKMKHNLVDWFNHTKAGVVENSVWYYLYTFFNKISTFCLNRAERRFRLYLDNYTK
jgi:hypothetical protein